MITKYTSLLEIDNKYEEQKMEFIFLQHLILCFDLTNRVFHIKYRYENPRDYFLKCLSDAGHKIIKEEAIHTETDIGELNDLHFSLYNCAFDIVVFNDIAVYCGDKGLGIFEYKNLEPGWFPPSENVKALLKDAVDKYAIEDFVENILEHVPSHPALRCRIFDKRIAEIALQMEEMNYRIFDELYRCPGESDDDEQRIESIQIYYDQVKGYLSTIEDMKRFEEEMQENPDELKDLIPRHRDLADKLGLNLQLFDAGGKRLTDK